MLGQVGQTWLTLKTLYGSWLDSVMADFEGPDILDGGLLNGLGKAKLKTAENSLDNGLHDVSSNNEN